MLSTSAASPAAGLGDADGVEDIRRALALALEQGLGRETAVIYGNLGAASWFHEGPRAALAPALTEAVEFSWEPGRGITEFVVVHRAGSLMASLA